MYYSLFLISQVPLSAALLPVSSLTLVHVLCLLALLAFHLPVGSQYDVSLSVTPFSVLLIVIRLRHNMSDSGSSIL